MPQSLKNSRCWRKQWRKNGKNWRKSRHDSWRKSETRKKWSKKQRRKAKKFMLCHWWIFLGGGIIIWKMGHCGKRISFVCSIHWIRVISVTNDSRTSHGYYHKTVRMRRTSDRWSIRLHSSQNGRYFNIIQTFQSQKVQRFGYARQKQWPASWCKTENVEPIWKIPMEGVDLVEPTRFLDHANLGCTQRECQISKDIASNFRDMLDLMQKRYLLGPIRGKILRICE